MANKFNVVLPCILSFEQMMEETEELSKVWWETHTFNTYGDWDDFFYSHLETAVPILNKKMRTCLIDQLVSQGLNKEIIEKIELDCSFYEIDDYVGLFTAKITGSKETLEKFLEEIEKKKIPIIYDVIPEDGTEMNYDFFKPCSMWDKENHRLPVYPFKIFQDSLSQENSEKI